MLYICNLAMTSLDQPRTPEFARKGAWPPSPPLTESRDLQRNRESLFLRSSSTSPAPCSNAENSTSASVGDYFDVLSQAIHSTPTFSPFLESPPIRQIVTHFSSSKVDLMNAQPSQASMVSPATSSKPTIRMLRRVRSSRPTEQGHRSAQLQGCQKT